MKVGTVMESSKDMMKSMGALVNAPAIGSNIRRMGEEMRQFGIVDEMMGEAMDEMAPDGLDEEVEALAAGLMAEITVGLAAAAPGALSGRVGTAVAAPAAATAAAAPRTAVAAGGGGGGGAAAAAAAAAGSDELRDRLDRS